MELIFHPRTSVEQVEEGIALAPKFDAAGVIPVVTTDSATGELLMHAYMNDEALRLTIQTGEAHYWSRSRQCLWRKGATSGLVQHIRCAPPPPPSPPQNMHKPPAHGVTQKGRH